MKRITWLFVLPWTVAVSSTCYTVGGVEECPKSFSAQYKGTTEWDCSSQEACEDFVQAMNSSHKTRFRDVQDGSTIKQKLKAGTSCLNTKTGEMTIGDCQEHPEDSQR